MDALRGFKKKVRLVKRNNHLWADDCYSKNNMVSISFVEHITYSLRRKSKNGACFLYIWKIHRTLTFSYRSLLDYLYQKLWRRTQFTANAKQLIKHVYTLYTKQVAANKYCALHSCVQYRTKTVLNNGSDFCAITVVMQHNITYMKCSINRR